jgi:hypothetical protein
MNRKLLALAILAAFALPSFSAAQCRRAQCANSQQMQARSAQRSGTTTQQRMRKRDGTGPNCTGNCLQRQTQQQSRPKRQTQADSMNK